MDTKTLHTWTLTGGETIAVESFAIDWRGLLHPRISGPVLHVGSKASVLDNSKRWRTALAPHRVVGMDLEPGDNVDVVCDIQAPLRDIRKKCDVVQFDAILCPHVLEHVKAPWEVAATLTHLLKPDGTLAVTVPWVQGFHEFPDDYWRMSFAGVRALFPKIRFDLEFYTGAKEDIGYRILRNGQPENSVATNRIERNLFQLYLDQAPVQRMFDDREGDKIQLSRAYMPACSVNLVGRKMA